jgi:acetyl esterase/lipase
MSMMTSVPLLLLAAAVLIAAEAPRQIPLWPQGAPGEKGDLGAERDTTTPKDGLVAGKPVVRVGNVSNPTMTIYRPPKNRDTGAAVIVFPGGGYSILAMDLEGTEVCDWLNSLGVTGVLVKYRVPVREGRPRYAAPLQDAQRALGLVRRGAVEWGIDPKRIGVLGFSAGAHLSAALSNNFENRTYEPLDEADRISCRPDFALLLYPGLIVSKERPDQLGPELAVTANTPPTFLAQAELDNVGVENSVFYYLALKKAKVPAEMHLYASGGHGYGLRPTQATVNAWPQRAEEWMRSLGVLK